MVGLTLSEHCNSVTPIAEDPSPLFLIHSFYLEVLGETHFLSLAYGPNIILSLQITNFVALRSQIIRIYKCWPYHKI